jgi:hypothetical protein
MVRSVDFPGHRIAHRSRDYMLTLRRNNCVYTALSSDTHNFVESVSELKGDKIVCKVIHHGLDNVRSKHRPYGPSGNHT